MSFVDQASSQLIHITTVFVLIELIFSDLFLLILGRVGSGGYDVILF